MAEFKQPIADPDTRFSDSIRPVKNTAVADAITGLGDIALYLGKEHKLNGPELDQIKAIQASRDFLAQDAIDRGLNKDEILAEQDFSKRIDKLSQLASGTNRAAAESRLRVMAEIELKKFKNKYPGLSDEFTAKASSILGFNPIGEAVNQADAINKEQVDFAETRLKAIEAEAKIYGYSLEEVRGDPVKQRGFLNLRARNQNILAVKQAAEAYELGIGVEPGNLQQLFVANAPALGDETSQRFTTTFEEGLRQIGITRDAFNSDHLILQNSERGVAFKEQMIANIEAEERMIDSYYAGKAATVFKNDRQLLEDVKAQHKGSLTRWKAILNGDKEAEKLLRLQTAMDIVLQRNGDPEVMATMRIAQKHGLDLGPNYGNRLANDVSRVLTNYFNKLVNPGSTMSSSDITTGEQIRSSGDMIIQALKDKFLDGTNVPEDDKEQVVGMMVKLSLAMKDNNVKQAAEAFFEMLNDPEAVKTFPALFSYSPPLKDTLSDVAVQHMDRNLVALQGVLKLPERKKGYKIDLKDGEIIITRDVAAFGKPRTERDRVVQESQIQKINATLAELRPIVERFNSNTKALSNLGMSVDEIVQARLEAVGLDKVFIPKEDKELTKPTNPRANR